MAFMGNGTFRFNYLINRIQQKVKKKKRGLNDIGDRMSIGNLILGVNSVTVWCLIRYDILLQNALGVITKWDSYFIIKCDRSLLQNASGFLL